MLRSILEYFPGCNIPYLSNTHSELEHQTTRVITLSLNTMILVYPNPMDTDSILIMAILCLVVDYKIADCLAKKAFGSWSPENRQTNEQRRDAANFGRRSV